MNFKRRLEDAIDYAVETDYSVWMEPVKKIEEIKKYENICLFGAGKLFRDRIGFFINHNIRVRYICDNDKKKHGNMIEVGTFKAKVISFEELLNLSNCVVIITVGNPQEIKKDLQKRSIVHYSLSELDLNSYTCHYPGKYFHENRKNILQCFDLLNDEKSQEVYTEVLCNRIAPHLALKSFWDLQEENEYFQTGLFELVPDKEYIVDAGAYTGDSLVQYMNLFKNRVGKYYCFEMNNEIADICEKVISEYQNSKLVIIRAGVSDKNETIYISDTGDCMSSTKNVGGGKNGTVEVRLVKLDDVLENEKVTYIKMDIEGEEMAALRGAERIIKSQQPKLGISAYHILSDMWEIPLLLKRYCSEYSIYFRHHSPTVCDTNCYAVIK